MCHIQNLHCMIISYKKKLGETWEELPPMFVTSSENRQGRDEVLNYIEAVNKTFAE